MTNATDQTAPRFPERGRNQWTDQLKVAVERPSTETSYCPEVTPGAAVEPDKRLGDAWLGDLEWGGEE